MTNRWENFEKLRDKWRKEAERMELAVSQNYYANELDTVIRAEQAALLDEESRERELEEALRAMVANFGDFHDIEAYSNCPKCAAVAKATELLNRAVGGSC